jgi:hypothetical protein
MNCFQFCFNFAFEFNLRRYSKGPDGQQQIRCQIEISGRFTEGVFATTGGPRQGLTLVDFSAESEPFPTQKAL